MKSEIYHNQMSKTLTQFYPISRKLLCTLIANLSVLNFAQALQETCHFSESSDKRSAYIRHGNMSITIHGWRHPGAQEISDLTQNFVNLVRQLKSGASCEQLSPIVDLALINKEHLINSSKELYTKLDSTPLMKTTTLAVEFSEEERMNAAMKNELFLKPNNLPKIQSAFESLKMRCPQMKAKVDQMKLITMTPENQYWLEQTQKGRSLSIRGVDDYQLRKESVAKLQELYGANSAMSSFDPEKEKYTPATRKEMDRIAYNMIIEGTSPLNSEIEKVLKSIQDPGTRERTEKGLKEWQLLGEYSDKRNVKMTENILKLKTDAIFIVGLSHLKGLQKEFAKTCKTVTGTLATSVKPAATISAAAQ